MSKTYASPFDTPGKLDQKIIANPYPYYRQHRSAEPVHWNEGSKSWDVTSFDGVMEVLRDRRFSSDSTALFRDQFQGPAREAMAPIMELFDSAMVASDPPNHTRLRSLANKAFTPRVIENMQAHIQEIVDRSLDDVQISGNMDLISDLAYPLPGTVICEMLGVPVEDRGQFKKWTDDLAAFRGGLGNLEEHAEAARSSVLAMIDYLKTVLKECRENPRDNLISALAAAEQQGDAFSEMELFSMFVFLQFAGHETTTNLIGNGILALLQNPEQLQKLRDDPSLIENGIEEFLRYHSPVQSLVRTALENLEIGGTPILKGQVVRIYLGAANRDPAQFSDPDRLDIAREGTRHVGFGFGIHFCLGAALARWEGKAAIGTVIRRLPELRLEPPMSEWRLEDFQWSENPVFHGLTSLPVVFKPIQ
jgi:cytochrome P450